MVFLTSILLRIISGFCTELVFLNILNNFLIMQLAIVLCKVREMQNYVDNRQIDRHGYHSIGNSRFSGKMFKLASENAHVKSYGGLKF